MKILYVDMDNVLVDFQSAFPKLEPGTVKKLGNKIDELDGIFSLMEPMPDAIEAFTFLSKYFDTYILSTAPWENPSAWKDKLLWVHKYLPNDAYKRLIITHNKNLNKGDYLIDDRLKNGVDRFEGEHIHFGQGDFKRWKDVIEYLCDKEKILRPKF